MSPKTNFATKCDGMQRHDAERASALAEQRQQICTASDVVLLADVHPDGGNRGLLVRKDGLQDIALEGGTLEMARTLYSGEVHRGVVRIPPAGGLS